MATAAEVALLRKLVGDTSEAPTFTDAELAAALDAAPSCPVPLDPDGFPIPGVVPDADTYGVAATLWEDRALAEETAGTALAEPVRVTSERVGDVSRSYGGTGKATGAAVLTPERMRTMARRLRKRSCNNAAARTIIVDAPTGQREVPVRGGLYPTQLVN